MAYILVYALHYEGAFNKNSLGAVSEGAKLASAIGGECHAIVVGDVSDDLDGSLGQYGATKVTTLNLEVVEGDAERGLLLIKGSVPGRNGSVVFVRNAVKAGVAS